jgi:small-conductance mechanosensitive channel
MFLNQTIPYYVSEVTGYNLGIFESKLSLSIAVLIVSVFMAFLADIIFEKVLLHYTSKSRFKCDNLIVAAVKKPIFYTFVLFGFFIATEILYTGNIAIEFISGIFFSFLAILWIISLLQVNKILFQHVFSHIVRKTESKMDDELLPLFKNLISVFIIFFGLLAILKGIWDLDIAPLFASAGIAGLAIAFAAKDSISQLFGGISIYFDQPFKLGDRIEIDGGEIGIVQDIGIRSTRIMNLYNNMIVIPNSIIANSRILNYTSPESTMMVKVNIGVAYGSDVAKVKRVLHGIAESIDVVLDHPQPYVRFDNHGDFSLDFALIMWVETPGEKFTVIDQVNTMINEQFKNEGIDIPFPTHTIIKAN